VKSENNENGVAKSANGGENGNQYALASRKQWQRKRMAKMAT
jgi:hypothetical protein